MTWEEILKAHGDKEYDEWLLRNGMSLDDVEKKVLDLIDEAAKVLLDPESDDGDKRFARKRLQKKLDELLGKKDRGEKSLQDEFEDLAKTKLSDNGDIAIDIDDISEDLLKNPEDMDEKEFSKTMNDIDKLMSDIEENADDIGGQFGKSGDDMYKDAENARNSLKDVMKKMHEGNLSKDEKKDLMDKAKDALEDLISDENEKEKLRKKRAERDAKKEAERLEKFKKVHPLRKFIIVMTNLADLYTIDLISEGTREILYKCIDDIELLTEKKFSDMKKKDLKDISEHLDELKESLLPDLVKLIENETILQKTEDDMKNILDGVFEHVFNAFRRIFDTTIDDNAKGSLIKMAAQKMRTIGKILKTQKKWRVSDEFKEAYIAEMKRLMKILKEGGDEELFKELYDKGVINPMMLDDNGRKLLRKLIDSGDVDTELDGSDFSGFDNHYSEDEGIPDYDGELYYTLETDDDGNIILSLSDLPDVLEDSDYEKFAKKFEKDFPEYWLEEEIESVFSIVRKDGEEIDLGMLDKNLKDHSDYKPGEWATEE